MSRTMLVADRVFVEGIRSPRSSRGWFLADHGCGSVLIVVLPTKGAGAGAAACGVARVMKFYASEAKEQKKRIVLSV